MQDATTLALDVPPERRALDLVAAGRLDEAAALVEAELSHGDLAGVTGEIVRGMLADDLEPAGVLARIAADLRLAGGLRAAAAHRGTADDRRLSQGKLRHDIGQLRYLRDRGVPGAEAADEAIAHYEAIADRLAPFGTEARQPLSERDMSEIGALYGRLAHVRETPRVRHGLSDAWTPATVEDRYLADRLGLVVVDDFLSEEALSELRAFCLESTVWNANRYPHGRLGAFFDIGFNCPLLLQIAEELRTAFPRVIGDRHRLRQLWGFKYPSRMPGEGSLHADFAAVNVNFWITPESANLNPESGGLLVYDVDAPRDWDFEQYNRRPDLIEAYLREHGAGAIRVPYRQNRAIIFNSDLFHATEEIHFRDSYEDRRVNVTMLYGVREHDERRLAGDEPAATSAPRMWRSSAFGRARR